MSEGFSFYLDAATINAANAAKRGVLDVPSPDDNDTLYVKSETEKKWREHLMVKETKIGPWEKDPEVIMATIQYRVTEDAYKTNAKRVVTKSYFMNTKAIKDPNHKDYKRTQMNLGKLNSLIRACGLTVEKDASGQVPYHLFFNGDKPLVGKTFWGVMRDYVYTAKDTGEVVSAQEVDNFVPEEV